MGFGRLLLILFMLFINLVSSILIIFKMEYFLLELVIISAIIIISIISVFFLIKRKPWAGSFMSILFSIIILNQIYIFINSDLIYLFTIAFLAALIGLLLSLSLKIEKKKVKQARSKVVPKPKVVTYNIPKRTAKNKGPSPSAKAATKKKAKKKSANKKKAKKKTQKKPKSQKKTAAKKKTVAKKKKAAKKKKR